MAKKKKNPHAVALGKLGGKKGGKARAAKLSPERRSEIAQQAARARWDREKAKKKKVKKKTVKKKAAKKKTTKKKATKKKTGKKKTARKKRK